MNTPPKMSPLFQVAVVPVAIVLGVLIRWAITPNHIPNSPPYHPMSVTSPSHRPPAEDKYTPPPPPSNPSSTVPVPLHQYQFPPSH